MVFRGEEEPRARARGGEAQARVEGHNLHHDLAPFFLMPPEMWRRGVASGEFPPDAETVGINKLDYYHSKFGGPARVAPMVERLAGIMRSLDVEYNMDGNTGPTLDGHRIAAYAERAEGLDKQNAFIEEIFKSYFTMAEGSVRPDARGGETSGA